MVRSHARQPGISVLDEATESAGRVVCSFMIAHPAPDNFAGQRAAAWPVVFTPGATALAATTKTQQIDRPDTAVKNCAIAGPPQQLGLVLA